MNSGTGKSFSVVYYVQLLNRAGLHDEASTVLLQSSSSGLSKTTMGIQSKQKIGSMCESFARSLRTGWILSVICVK